DTGDQWFERVLDALLRFVKRGPELAVGDGQEIQRLLDLDITRVRGSSRRRRECRQRQPAEELAVIELSEVVAGPVEPASESRLFVAATIRVVGDEPPLAARAFTRRDKYLLDHRAGRRRFAHGAEFHRLLLWVGA